MSLRPVRPALAACAAATALSFATPGFAWETVSPWQDFSPLRPYAFNYSCVYSYPSAAHPSKYCPVYGYWGYPPEGWPYRPWWLGGG